VVEAEGKEPKEELDLSVNKKTEKTLSASSLVEVKRGKDCFQW